MHILLVESLFQWERYLSSSKQKHLADNRKNTEIKYINIGRKSGGRKRILETQKGI